MRNSRTSIKKLLYFKNKQKKTNSQASKSEDPSTKGDHSILNEHYRFDVCLMNTNNNIVQDNPMSWFID